MPIRIRRDKPQSDPGRQRNDDPQRPSPQRPDKPFSGIPIWVRWLPVLIWFLIKKPKFLIPVLVGLGIWYFVIKPIGQQVFDFEYQTEGEDFSYGATLSEEEYDKAYVFEPLEVGSSGLPTRISLENYAPKPLHQGRQGSCSGWAAAYSARTISYAMSSGQDPNAVAFSPSFLYNQIALQGCQGAYLRNAMEAMRTVGSLPFRQFGYTDQTCQIMPDPTETREASNYKIKGYTRLSQGAGNYAPNVNAIKQHLAQNAPVVIGMMVGQSFQQAMMGSKLWKPSRQDYAGYGLGGHAMSVIGYDDNIAGGSFRLMNSWSEKWGDRGFGWVTYDDFTQFTKEAYGLYPEGKARKFDRTRLDVTFGLVDNATQSIIPLTQVDEIVFRTQRPLQKGAPFKIMVRNKIECHIYVFGMETDGSNYVLFPYTQKHSPYCGITGQRLFPKDYSLEPDDIGNRDYMAVVVSKDPLDPQRINRVMNQNPRENYTERMVKALIDEFVLSCDFDVNGTVSLDCPIGERNALGMIIEIDKR